MIGVTEETHQATVRRRGDLYLWTCEECSFEANYNPDLSRFHVIITGNPFAQHICHHLPQQTTIRDLVEELESLGYLGEFEVEY